MNNIDDTGQKTVVLNFYYSEPNFRTTYWISDRSTIYAYVDGEFYLSSDEGQPICQVSLRYRIKIPPNLHYGHLYQGFYPDLSIEEIPSETLVQA